MGDLPRDGIPFCSTAKIHREFPHVGGSPSPTDFAGKVEVAPFAGGGGEGHF